MDVKVAVPLLLVPNVVMDAIQLGRLGGLGGAVRRTAVLLGFGVVGTMLGTRLLVALPGSTVTAVVGVMVLLFVVLNATPLRPRVPAPWAPWLAPPVGLMAGVTGGLANVPGLPLVIYFYSLGMGKAEFVRTVAFTFLVYKVVQLGAVAYYGLLTWRVLAVSFGLTVLGLGAFRLGLAVQERLEQRTFNRAVLVFLAALGTWLVARTLR